MNQVKKVSCVSCEVARTAGANFCPQCGNNLLAVKEREDRSVSDDERANERQCNDESRRERAEVEKLPDVPMEDSACPEVRANPVLEIKDAGVQACECGRGLEADFAFCPQCGEGLAESSDSGLWLTQIGDHENPIAMPLQSDALIIGADLDCDLVLDNDKYVSRRHARIRSEDGLLWLDDLGSSNGTLLRIKRSVILEPGDELLVGASVLRLEHRGS